MTPNRFTWILDDIAGGSGPTILLASNSSARYLATGSGCYLAEAMLEVADLHEQD